MRKGEVLRMHLKIIRLRGTENLPLQARLSHTHLPNV